MNSLIKVIVVLLTVSLITQTKVHARDLNASEQEPDVLSASRYDRSLPLPELLELMRLKEASQDKLLKKPKSAPANILDIKKSENKTTMSPLDFKDLAPQIFLGTSMPETSMSFDGIGKIDTVDSNPVNLNILPPDTNGDVGLQYYVQYINTNWAVFDKASGSLVSDVIIGNSFWAGFGGFCESDNHGDPIVLFDKIAQVWVFTQFGEFSSADTEGGGFQCFAISDRADLMDPAVTFYRYEYQFIDSINDYPHLTIWNDESGARSGYYMTTHDFTIPLGTATFQQASFSVFERDAMLAGLPAKFIRFKDTTHFGNTAFGALSVHLESAVMPPAGMCAPFITNDRNATNQGYYAIWQLCVDWDNVGLSTLSNPIKLTTDLLPFDYAGVNTIQQPNPAPAGSELADLSGFTMYRVSARAYPPASGKPVELVLNHTMHAGDGVAGVLWAHIALQENIALPDLIFASGFETGTTTQPFATHIIQEGFYSPDDERRWMGAISLDQAGNIGLAYSTASTTTFPSVRFTGREATDPLGQLRVESSCVDGGGIQSWVDSGGGASRWGDYSSMSIDPVDQCTFWSSNEYIAVSGQTNWENRICSFRFENCGDPDFNIISTTPATLNICTTDADPIVNLEIRAFGGFNGTVNLTSTGLTNGASLAFDNNNLTIFPATSNATISNLAAANTNLMNLSINADSVTPAISKSRNILLDIALGTVGATNLQLPANGSIEQSVSPTLTWDLLDNADNYSIEIATDLAFTTIIETGTSKTNSYQTETLLTGGTQYFWRVSTSNHCGQGLVSSVFEFTTGIPGNCPTGTTDNVVFSEDVEGDVSAWTIQHGELPPGTPFPITDHDWEVSTVMANNGINSFYAIAPHVSTIEPESKTDTQLISPAITLPAASQMPITLSYWNFQALAGSHDDFLDINRCESAAIIEISIDGGLTFNKIKNNNMLTTPYHGTTRSSSIVSTIPGQLSWCTSAANPDYGLQENVSVVQLDQYAGQTVQLKFRSSSIIYLGPEPGGWWIDDIEVKGCN